MVEIEFNIETRTDFMLLSGGIPSLKSGCTLEQVRRRRRVRLPSLLFADIYGTPLTRIRTLVL